jgi:hypothetical protein
MKKLHLHLGFCAGDSNGLCLPKTSAASFTLKYWSEDAEIWVAIDGTSIDGTLQTVSLESNSIETYYALFYATEGSTGILSQDAATPHEFSLAQNYPNPFNPTTTISYQLNERSLVKLTVYNTLGHEVRALVNAVKDAGSHQATWNGRDNLGNALPSGVYFYRLAVNDQVQTRRMVFMK